MDTSFWLERWQQRQIGFHQQQINSNLVAYWSRLGISSTGSVFVPLCGKSRDMQWLRQQGHTVVGIELARTAIEEFFVERQTVPQVSRDKRFELWEAPGYRLLCGDFFALEPHDLKDVHAVFDRAALVALPASLRERYVAKLAALLPHASTLLVALSYPQDQMNGPPFSVDEAEVRRLYKPYRIEKLRDEGILTHADNARFKERGVQHMTEQVYWIATD